MSPEPANPVAPEDEGAHPRVPAAAPAPSPGSGQGASTALEALIRQRRRVEGPDETPSDAPR